MTNVAQQLLRGFDKIEEARENTNRLVRGVLSKITGSEASELFPEWPRSMDVLKLDKSAEGYKWELTRCADGTLSARCWAQMSSTSHSCLAYCTIPRAVDFRPEVAMVVYEKALPAFIEWMMDIVPSLKERAAPYLAAGAE